MMVSVKLIKVYFKFYKLGRICSSLICVFFIDDLQRLKNNSLPFAVVAEKWKNTTKIRTDQFPQTISDYYRLFSSLKNPSGHLLLEIDFKNLFPGKEHCLINKCSSLSKIILRISENRKDRFLKDIISKYKQEHNITNNFSLHNVS
jgi:hypothetical protein